MISNTPLSNKANRTWSVITPPAIEPVTLEEVKAYGRIDGTEEDTLLSSFISTVTENMEGYLRRSLINRTIALYLDYWPGTIVKLPQPPLQSITSVETLDESNVATVYDADNYYPFVAAVPGELVLKVGVNPPVNLVRERGGFRITFISGYGDDAEDVPAIIRMAIKDWVIESFDSRNVNDEPPARWAKKLSPFRVSPYAYGR